MRKCAVFVEFLESKPKFCGICVSTKFLHQELGETTVFYALFLDISYHSQQKNASSKSKIIILRQPTLLKNNDLETEMSPMITNFAFTVNYKEMSHAALEYLPFTLKLCLTRVYAPFFMKQPFRDVLRYYRYIYRSSYIIGKLAWKHIGYSPLLIKL